MSGGSYNYIYSTLSEECEGYMHDEEMNTLIKDLCKVLHDLEWWQSYDISEEDYRKTVAKFKQKWLHPTENKGEWIYDKGINNWRCSRCGQTPPPTGYVGKADFMATYFKFCPDCGADMRGKSCNTCKNNDDEFSGECYECVKNIQNHYEPKESEK